MVFDIAQMGEQIRAVGLQVILEYVWQRVVANKRRGVRTWVWIDEFSIMFNDGAGRTTHKSGEFFSKVYKRIRKYGGVPTAMTQNITEVLASSQARTLMKLENKGLGTAATRASIINALFAREYIAKKGKTIYPTEKGIFLIDNLPVAELKNAELTGEWGKRLHNISDGKEEYQKFIQDIEQNVRSWYETIAHSNSNTYTSKADQLSCPICGAKVIKGKFRYFCSSKKEKGCNFSIPSELCSKAITDTQVLRLIEKGKTTVIKGFKSKAGK